MKFRPRRATALVKVFVAAAAVFVASELALRTFFPMDALVYEDSENPLLSFQLRPNASGSKNGVDVVVNAQGLRDDPVPSPRPHGERRVVVVGGHETFGVGVPAERTYVRELSDGLIGRGDGRMRTFRWASERVYLWKTDEVPRVGNYEAIRHEFRRFKARADAAGVRALGMLLPDISGPQAPAPSGFASAAKENGLTLFRRRPAPATRRRPTA